MAIISHDPRDDVSGGDATYRSPRVSQRSAPARVLAALVQRIDDAFSDKRRNISRPKLLFAISSADAAIVVATGVLALYLFDVPGSLLQSGIWMAVIALATTFELRRNWSYSVHALRRPGEQVGKIARSAVVVFCVAAGAGYLIGRPPFAPIAGAAWLATAIALMSASRLVTARILAVLTNAGRLVRRTVIVGGGPDAEQLIAAFERDNLTELSILGVFDDRFDDRSADSISGYPKLGNFDQLPEFCRTAGVDLMIVTVPMTAEQRLMQILQLLLVLPVDIRVSALSAKLRLSSGAYTYIGRVPMLALMDRPLTDWDRVIKNIEDRVLGTLLFILAAPVMALVAFAIRLDSKGPILFKQRRFGFNNELIEVLKFRSMYTDMADASASKLVTKDDPRVTRVGRFIRKTSLDELPQLINVIKGEMSLVGPRPLPADDGDFLGDVRRRLLVRPGMTGLWQVSGRSDLSWDEAVRLDLYYVDNWSLAYDLSILWRTVGVVLARKGAY